MSDLWHLTDECLILDQLFVTRCLVTHFDKSEAGERSDFARTALSSFSRDAPTVCVLGREEQQSNVSSLLSKQSDQMACWRKPAPFPVDVWLLPRDEPHAVYVVRIDCD